MSSSSEESEEMPVKKLYSRDNDDLSSSEPPMEEWSSLMSIVPMKSHKMTLYEQGLFKPGSDEICTKYIPLSASSVIRHPYYAYPGIKDPGIKEALLDPEPRKVYPLDGQELYLDLCEEMKVMPVRSFVRGLLEETIDLRYYGVNPVGVRAMSMALNCNQYVRRLDLTSNFLSEDACYHLGQMLRENVALQELVFCECRLQVESLRKLVVNLYSRSLELLDLSRNDFGDDGFKHLAYQLSRGAIMRKLNLSYNGLTSASASLFASAIEGNNCITHLDLSWNKMSRCSQALLKQLSCSKVLIELNMSWNAVKISRILRKLLTVPTLRILDLSNNRISRQGVTAIVNNLQSAVSLHTLDLSYNPITSRDALLLLSKLQIKSIRLVNLIMDNIEVNRDFVKERARILSLKYRRNCKITYGPVRHNYVLSTPDLREILLKRFDFLTSRGSKRHQLDIGLYFLEKKQLENFIQPRQVMRDMKIAGIAVDNELIDGVADMFPGPKLEKGGKTMDLVGITEIVMRLWPEKKLPPKPEPGPEEKNVKEGRRGKKKKKK
ncbi:leucine-rich repeat-containing protein 74B-like [Danaus plexippus]|uniref:leucine-rich repeat-containing protein 74B-like n=1 Tax=Danaus plexippus TaxID=13037 RepID=UPI002AAF3AEC|nr:leucine-rich repeat-containing protein 74B-like [Danaus plexippus]